MKKIKKVAILYVYDHSSCTDHNIVAFVAPNNDFMTSIFKTFEGDWGTSWGDFEEFQRTDEDGAFDKWELKTTLELTPDGLESLGMDPEDFKENIKTPLKDLSIENFQIYGFDKSTYNKLFFDAKSLIEPFKNLDNDQLDSLIKALKSLKK
jgi:hypothetical protein